MSAESESSAGHLQRATFDAIAHHYDQTIPRHIARHYLRKRLRLILSLVPAGSRVLDIGCGTGRLAVHLRRNGLTMVGLDSSREMLKQLNVRQGIGVVQAEFERLPFRSESFEAAATIATLHHAVQVVVLERMLQEIVRVVKPGGLLILWDHNPNNPYWHWLMPRLPQDRGGYRLVSLRELMGRLRAIGRLEMVQIRRMGAVPLAAGNRIISEPEVAIEGLHPPPGLLLGVPAKSNDNSLVLKVTKGSVSMLLTGDIEEAGLLRLLEAGEALQATVLKVPHHGSRLGEVGQRFFRRVAPRIALLSVGRLHRLPAAQTLEVLRRAGAAVYSTREDGALRVRTDGASVDVHTFRGG